MTRELTAATEHAGVRLDAFLSADGALTRSQAARLIAEGRVRVNGKPAAKSARLSGGETVTVDVPQLRETALPPQDIPLDVVYEDDDVIVVNKPTGLVDPPAPGHPDGTLVIALLHHCGDSRSGIGGEKRPGIVHRIDKDTSGLVLAAQNGYAAPLLAQRVEKLYYAVVEGELPLGPGVIDAPIGRQGESSIGRCVTPDGKPSRTEYTILKAQNGLSLAACVPVTGRTHQIRVHFASIGHPLAGDDLYGGSRARIGRQALHCAKQTFWVPRCEPMPDGIGIEVPVDETTLRPVTVESPLPEDMTKLFV